MPAASTSSVYLDEADRQVGEQRATDDAGIAQSRLTTSFEQFMPQFQGAVGARGQTYSTARKSEEAVHGQDYLNSSFDIQNALQRRLDDFTRQRMYASVGLVGF